MGRVRATATTLVNAATRRASTFSARALLVAAFAAPLLATGAFFVLFALLFALDWSFPREAPLPWSALVMAPAFALGPAFAIGASGASRGARLAILLVPLALSLVGSYGVATGLEPSDRLLVSVVVAAVIGLPFTLGAIAPLSTRPKGQTGLALVGFCFGCGTLYLGGLLLVMLGAMASEGSSWRPADQLVLEAASLLGLILVGMVWTAYAAASALAAAWQSGRVWIRPAARDLRPLVDDLFVRRLLTPEDRAEFLRRMETWHGDVQRARAGLAAMQAPRTQGALLVFFGLLAMVTTTVVLGVSSVALVGCSDDCFQEVSDSGIAFLGPLLGGVSFGAGASAVAAGAVFVLRAPGDVDAQASLLTRLEEQPLAWREEILLRARETAPPVAAR